MSAREKLLIYFTAAWFAVLAGVHALVFEPMADGQKAPDSRYAGYSTDDVLGWSGSLDTAERLTFLRWHTGFLDFVFPLLLMIALFVGMSSALRQFPRFRRQPSWVRTALLLIVIAPYGLFDFMENGLVADMLRGEVPINDVSVGLASTYTVLKFSFVAIAMIVVMGLTLVAKRQRST